MDALKIKSKFGRLAVAHILGRTLKKKLGIDTNLVLNEFIVNDIGSQYTIHLDGTFQIGKEDLKKLLQMGDEE